MDWEAGGFQFPNRLQRDEIKGMLHIPFSSLSARRGKIYLSQPGGEKRRIKLKYGRKFHFFVSHQSDSEDQS